MKEVNKRKSVNKRRKEEKKILEKERVKRVGSKSSKANVTVPTGEVSAPRKPSLAVKTVINDAKRGDGWWRKQSWRYGDGYWERVKKEDKKGKVKKQREEEEVRCDGYGRPVERSGWYSDTD
jgi:hypothetical protein